MSDLINTLMAAGRSARELLITVAIAVGGLLMIGGCLYRVVVHPEWSAAQALETLWPYYLAGALTIVFGWLVDRTEL